MKNRVITAYVTFISTIVFLAVAIVFSLIVVPYNHIYSNIGYAVFGSSLVAFIIALIEYFQTKRYTSEQFFLEFIKFLNAFAKISYFALNENEFLYAKYLTNEKMFWKIDKTGKKDFMESARRELEKSMPWLKDFSEDIFEKYVTDHANEFEKKLKANLRLYVEFTKYSTITLGNLYNDFFFFFNNKKRHIEIFDNLYKPAIELHRKISFKASYFSDYLDGSGQNVYVMTHKLKEISDLLFEVVESDNSLKVYAKKFNDLADAVEEYRCKIYGQKYIKDKHTPIYSSFKNVSLEVKSDSN